MTYLLAFAVALLSSLVFTPLVRALATKFSLLDIPDGQRFHSSPVPLLGGVAVVSAILVGVLLSFPLLGVQLGAGHLILGSGIVLSFALGLYDDRKGMGALRKISGQALCAAALVVGCYAGGWIEGWFLSPLLFVWVVGMMNAINFLDNMDGVAGGVIALTSLTFLFLLVGTQHWTGIVLAGALCGATIGFLRFNFPPASIFLGDAGSLPLGYLLSAVSIMVAGQAMPHSLLTPLVVLAYPVFDTTFVTIVRVKERRKFYQGGKDHSSHRLAALSGSTRKTALVIYLVCVVLGLLAFLVEHVESLLFSASVVAALLVLFSFLGLRLVKVKTGAPA
ncbi:MAG: undecaprenyl/decaprenyl-phosphate alpha-N-acetylglucosaminyl 1-phosphate transferase [Candidatus Eiseniibacteriota bacterium]|nr:MAG: undecaprenyl/decaprenyl-phosphate alpha-N-acetylglucosaminyl 1-phosphate transferase [Candidatus Eisenbacteria bacterium]